jgi:hypothetical protein
MVVLTPARPAGEITVLNPRATPAAFTVDLHFGYVTTDSSGAPRVELVAGPDSASAAEWITPYPRRFTLRPGASRIVRLLARAPADISHGEYWARLTVHSHDTSSAPSSVMHDTTTRDVRLTLETATVIPVFFRKGDVTTGIQVDSMRASVDGDSVDVRVALTRRGNAAFLGIAHLILLDERGREMAAADRQFAVYRSTANRWRIPVPSQGAAIPSFVNVLISTRRGDIPSRLVLKADVVRHEVAISRP